MLCVAVGATILTSACCSSSTVVASACSLSTIVSSTPLLQHQGQVDVVCWLPYSTSSKNDTLLPPRPCSCRILTSWTSLRCCCLPHPNNGASSVPLRSFGIALLRILGIVMQSNGMSPPLSSLSSLSTMGLRLGLSSSLILLLAAAALAVQGGGG